MVIHKEKKEEFRFIPMTKALTPTDNFRKYPFHASKCKCNVEEYAGNNAIIYIEHCICIHVFYLIII